MQARAHAVLDAAWAAGVRYFDAARSYGRAEEFLASWLSVARHRARRGRRRLEVGLHLHCRVEGWCCAARGEGTLCCRLTAADRESRAVLGEYLDLYQIHSATLESGVLENQSVLEELARLRRDGLAIGLTLSGPQQADTLRQAMQVRVENAPVFDVVQATWNLLEPSVGPALQAAHAAGVGVIIKEALANGRLTARNHDPGFAAQRRLLEEVAAQCAATVDALALAAVLAQPWVDVVLAGAATVEHLRSNVAATTVAWDASIAERLAALAEDPRDYWARRGQLAWN